MLNPPASTFEVPGLHIRQHTWLQLCQFTPCLSFSKLNCHLGANRVNGGSGRCQWGTVQQVRFLKMSGPSQDLKLSIPLRRVSSGALGWATCIWAQLVTLVPKAVVEAWALLSLPGRTQASNHSSIKNPLLLFCVRREHGKASYTVLMPRGLQIWPPSTVPSGLTKLDLSPSIDFP